MLPFREWLRPTRRLDQDFGPFLPKPFLPGRLVEEVIHLIGSATFARLGHATLSPASPESLGLTESELAAPCRPRPSCRAEGLSR